VALLRTEADIVRSLKGTVTLAEIYERCQREAAIDRDRGEGPPTPRHRTDRRWKHRVRGTIANLVRSGAWERAGRATWLIRGSVEEPHSLVLLDASGLHEQFELHLTDAVELLAGLERSADLICCDPPYALAWDTDRSPGAKGLYARDQSMVVDGYVDVAPDTYAEWTFEWVAAAAGALRPGAQIAVTTGPQQAALVQYAAEQAGLTWVASIAAYRHFALRTLSRPACAHWTVTVLCQGPLAHPDRVFNVAGDLPRSREGRAYPLDWWAENGRSDRPGLVRYANGLPLRLVRRIVVSFSRRAQHVVDPFLGGGTTAIAAWLLDRCFTGGDLNPGALRFTAARLLEEHIRPAERQPALFDASIA
jgi:hypothetical protein